MVKPSYVHIDIHFSISALRDLNKIKFSSLFPKSIKGIEIISHSSVINLIVHFHQSENQIWKNIYVHILKLVKKLKNRKLMFASYVNKILMPVLIQNLIISGITGDFF